jgi:hypothetical protein
MLRALVALLLVANLAFFGWTRGWLDSIVGIPAHGDREPGRLANQVNPESVVILSAANAVLPATRATCLEAGPFQSKRGGRRPKRRCGSSRRPRQAGPTCGPKPGAWLVYMGSYSDRDALRRKEEEIRRLRPDFEEVSVPGEASSACRSAASTTAASPNAPLQVQLRGIRTARVVQASPPAVFHMLRLRTRRPGWRRNWRREGRRARQGLLRVRAAGSFQR